MAQLFFFHFNHGAAQKQILSENKFVYIDVPVRFFSSPLKRGRHPRAVIGTIVLGDRDDGRRIAR